MLKTLQFLIGGAVGWGFVFASIMQISENPWYHTVLGIVVGLVIFGWGLRPILGKSAIKYVFLGTLGSAGSIAFIGFLGSDTVLSPYLGFLSLLAISTSHSGLSDGSLERLFQESAPLSREEKIGENFGIYTKRYRSRIRTIKIRKIYFTN